MSFLDCVEIGTSDFAIHCTLGHIRTGLCIEPILYYLDRIQIHNKPEIKKINCAISNESGRCPIFYVTPDTIIKMNFPDWFRGCNSINNYHPTVVRVIEEKGLDPIQYISSYIVNKKTLLQVLDEEGVQQMYMLKIDTEGHDCIILNKYLDDIQEKHIRLPYELFFETNILTDDSLVNSTIDRLSNLGYDLSHKDDSDTLLRLNLQKIKNKSNFSPPLQNYYIMNHPEGYNVQQPEHENTLESAMEYCKKNGYAGVTFQNERYQIRVGPYVFHYDNGEPLTSWVYL